MVPIVLYKSPLEGRLELEVVPAAGFSLIADAILTNPAARSRSAINASGHYNDVLGAGFGGAWQFQYDLTRLLAFGFQVGLMYFPAAEVGLEKEVKPCGDVVPIDRCKPRWVLPPGLFVGASCSLLVFP